MGLEAVEEQIRREARAEADAIVEAARAERERQLAQGKERGAQAVEATRIAAREAGDRLRVQELARAELDARKVILLAQKEVLDEVRERTLEGLQGFRGNESVLKGLLEAHRAEVEDGRVYCAEKDAPLVKKLVGKRFAGTIDCVGGLVVESESGDWRSDLRYETLLQSVWQRSMKDIAGVLWRA